MKIILIALATLTYMKTISQSNFLYEVTQSNPYGLPNPHAADQIKDFAHMIGLSQCKSTTRKQDGSWYEPEDMTWKWSYIMNGMAVQDETLKEEGSHTGSIRQYIQDSSRWFVHFYSSASPSSVLPVWEGNKEGDNIVLYREQQAPNGADGYFRLTFYDMRDDGYKWKGEWVDTGETIVYPTWKIDCKKDDENKR